MLQCSVSSSIWKCVIDTGTTGSLLSAVVAVIQFKLIIITERLSFGLSVVKEKRADERMSDQTCESGDSLPLLLSDLVNHCHRAVF